MDNNEYFQRKLIRFTLLYSKHNVEIIYVMVIEVLNCYVIIERVVALTFDNIIAKMVAISLILKS